MEIKKASEKLTSEESLRRADYLVQKWFIDTAEKIEDQVLPERRSDMLCITALSVSVNYTNSILRLLHDDFRMPVKALLRVLCELSAKVAWCMISPKGKGRQRDRAVEKKLNQWDKYTEFKNMMILKEFYKIVSEEEKPKIEKAIKDKQMAINSLKCRRMPKMIEIFNRLPGQWRRGIYPKGFLQFNNAIHIDLMSLGDRMVANGEEMTIDFDSTESIEELVGYALSFVYQIYAIVRLHFGWDVRQMEKEFISIKVPADGYDDGEN